MKPCGKWCLSRSVCKRGTRSARHWLVWSLFVLLPVYGLSGALIELTGPSHHHRSASLAADSLAGWQDFRRVDSGVALAHEPHDHKSSSRHHHSLADETVVALDEQAQQSTSGPNSTLVATYLATATPLLVSLVGQGQASAVWPRCGPERVTTMPVAPLERPPRA